MMKFSFNGNTIVFKDGANDKFISIHLSYRILAFAVNEYYIVVIEDWEHLDCKENLYIFNLNGELLFKIQPAPRALYENSGFYNSIGFESDHILIAQSMDYRYRINLNTNQFISEEYTK